MKKLIPFAIAFGLMMPLAHAQKKTETAKDKTTAADTKKPEKKAKETTADKKKDTKPEDLSESDKALLADAKKEADALTPTQHTKLMELANKGTAKELEAVEGIGEVRAKSIIAKRPFAKAEDVAMVDGVGIETFKNLCTSVKGGAKPTTEKPAKPAAGKPAKATTEKPTTEKPKATEKSGAKPATTPPAATEKPATPSKPVTPK